MIHRIVVHAAAIEIRIEIESVIEIAVQLGRQAVVTSRAATPLAKLGNLATTRLSDRPPRLPRRWTDVAARTSWSVTAETAPLPSWIMNHEREEETEIEEIETETESETAVPMVTTSVAVHAAEDNTAQCKSDICMYVCICSPSSTVCLFSCRPIVLFYCSQSIHRLLLLSCI